MVVKVPSSNSAPASPDPLRGVSAAPSSSSSASSGRISKEKETEVEFSRLKNLVPAISKKNTVSKLDVILEAIRYIDQLQDQLVDQIAENRVPDVLAASAMLSARSGKENTDSAALFKMLAESQRRSRHKSE